MSLFDDITAKITRLSTAKTAIASAITAKGGTVASGDGFEDFASDVASIPSGSQKYKVGHSSATLDSTDNTISFNGVLGEPKAFIVANVSGGYYWSAGELDYIINDASGTICGIGGFASISRITTDKISSTYADGVLTVSSSSTQETSAFVEDAIYQLIYIYGGAGEFSFHQVDLVPDSSGIFATAPISEMPEEFFFFPKSSREWDDTQRLTYIISGKKHGNRLVGVSHDVYLREKFSAAGNSFEVFQADDELIISTMWPSGTGAFEVGKNYTLYYVTASEADSEIDNVQVTEGFEEVRSTTLKGSGLKLTVAKTGIYTVSWSGYRSSNQSNFMTQLTIDGVAYGGTRSTFRNTYGHQVALYDVPLQKGQVVEVQARSYSTSTAMGVCNLCIIQTG